MNSKEQAAHDAMVKKGWKVYRNGWPDFLVLRKTHDGRTVEGCAIEFKAKGDQVRPAQEEMHAALKSLGIPVHIMKSDHHMAMKSVGRGFFRPASIESLRLQLESAQQSMAIMEKRIKDIEGELESSSLLFEPEEAGTKLFGAESQGEREARALGDRINGRFPV